MSPTRVAARLGASILAGLALLDGAAAQRFAGRGGKQDADAPTDWNDDVRLACTAKRYGLQLAASRKVAKAGDEAVPAILAWTNENGANALPSIFVNAIADAGTTGPKTAAMLRGWADDLDFYWRAQALRGLAERRQAADRDRFARGIDDPSYLYRMFAAKGLLQLGDPADRDRVAQKLLDDPDPRVRPAIAGMLLDLGDTRAVQVLVDALALDHVFLGDPWGTRAAVDAFKALHRWLDVEIGWPRGNDVQARGEAIDAIVAAIRAKGVDIGRPTSRKDPGRDAVGGISIRSCRNGDLFVRWDTQGRLFVGLDGTTGPDLGGEAWPILRQFLTRDPAVATYGVVICDFVRIVDEAAGTSVKAAPAALPEDVSAGLKRVASALDEKGSKALGEALLHRLRQFADESH